MKNPDRTLLAFGRNVARIRAERGFSQDKLAEKADLDLTDRPWTLCRCSLGL